MLETAAAAGSRVLVFTLLVGDWGNSSQSAESKLYSKDVEMRPLWLNTSLMYNTDHCERFGHTFEIVYRDTPAPTSWQARNCKNAEQAKEDKCIAGLHRKNANWLKLSTVLGYLEGNAADWVLFVDADVVIHTRPGMNTLRAMITELEGTGKQVMFGDEDWKHDEAEKGRHVEPARAAWEIG